MTGGTTTSTKQFVWCGNERCEVRDGAGALVNQYFPRGQVNVSGGTSSGFFYFKDHLGSLREMTNSSGSTVYQQGFHSFGRPIVIVNTITPDFGYAAYYLHARSDLNLTRTRAYSSVFGRFVSRDPIEEKGGINLYEYAANGPLKFIDPSGLSPCSDRQHPYKNQPYRAYEGNVPYWQQPAYAPPPLPPTPTSDSEAIGFAFPNDPSLDKLKCLLDALIAYNNCVKWATENISDPIERAGFIADCKKVYDDQVAVCNEMD